jgi:hypothetical protein
VGPGGHPRRHHPRSPANENVPANNSSFSSPVTLSACSGPTRPQVLFPQETPFRRTGTGAIVLQGATSCPPGAAPTVAAVDSQDVPAQPRSVPAAPQDATLVLGQPLAAAATAKGQIVLVAASDRSPSSAPGRQALLSEGAAGGPFLEAQPLPGLGGPVGVATAYRGDVVIASREPGGDGGIQLRMQGYAQERFAQPVALGGGGSGQRVLAAALDYRTDAMVVWWQDGWLCARERHANGPLGRLQRFAKAPANVQLTMLISDDGRAIVAWLDPGARGASLYLDISAPGMRLGPGRLVERLRWGSRELPANAAVRLVRLSTESVLMAWTGTVAGHFVVRAAGLDLQGLRTTVTISPHGQDALLQDLATGPRGDAVALWSAYRPSGERPPRRARIFAAWGVPSSRGNPRFGPPTLLSPANASSDASVAIDPRSDRALASWREANGEIRYAVGHATR